MSFDNLCRSLVTSNLGSSCVPFSFKMADFETEETQKGDRRVSHQELPTVPEVQDEMKRFKENLLQSIATKESFLSDDDLRPSKSRSRSASRARDALVVPPNVQAELDEHKLFELKEAFLLFDLNGDGIIDINDLRGTFVSLGENIAENDVQNMLAEAPSPLDFDGFVNLLGYKTIQLDSEETLIAALSRWDSDNSGLILEDKIRHDLMTWGDRFTEKEADYALDEAPTVQKGGHSMIDYASFCSLLCGLRKVKK